MGQIFMSVNISLIVLKKNYGILMNFVDFRENFPWFWLIFCYPDPFHWSGSGSGWPKWNGSIRIRIRIRNTAFYTLKLLDDTEIGSLATGPLPHPWPDRTDVVTAIVNTFPRSNLARPLIFYICSLSDYRQFGVKIDQSWRWNIGELE